MPPKTKTPPTREQIDDSARLKQLYESRVTIGQLEFGHKYSIGNQAMVWQYLNADKPKGSVLNVAAAIKFATGLECLVADFSPSLQSEIDFIAQFASNKVTELPQMSALKREVLELMDNMSERGQHELALQAAQTQERRPREQSKQRS